MFSPRTNKGFYNIYPPWWKDWAREYKKGKVCEQCSKAISLTVAHLDQNPQNNNPDNLKVLCTSCHIKFDQKFHVFSMLSYKKNDNSCLDEKVELRVDSLQLVSKKRIVVLEAFAGDGKIWNEVQARCPDIQIDILKIEVKDNKKGVYLKGDNNKFLPLFDFETFDVIDLDAYGSPYNQLEVVFAKKYTGIVHCTYIQTGMGRLNNKMLRSLGYTDEMIKKVPSLFSKDPLGKMEQYLSNNGVKKITGFFMDRKNYFWFKIV